MQRTRLSLWMPVLCVALGSWSMAALADTPPNLVVNGSFEGANGLAGWSIGGTAGDAYLPVAIQYNQTSRYPTGAQGESVPTDNARSASPDAAGSNGVYFVSDSATNLSVYQYVYLTPGSYDIGFDTYATYNGFLQPLDANFAASIAGVQLADFEVSNVAPGTWATHSGEAFVSVAGEYLVSFVFNTSDGNSKDIVVDRAYVVSDSSGGGVPIAPVPEPSSFALMVCGIGLTGCVLRRKRTQVGNASP